MARASYKGLFVPTNPEKYIGDSSNIVFRSLWERQVMIYLDNNPNVIEWGSEELPIRYLSPKDNQIHRYFPDFIVKAKRDGEIVNMIWEVKPLSQTLPPKMKRNKTKRFLEEQLTYAVNQSKFEAAQAWCDHHGWEFMVITEQQLRK